MLSKGSSLHNKVPCLHGAKIYELDTSSVRCQHVYKGSHILWQARPSKVIVEVPYRRPRQAAMVDRLWRAQRDVSQRFGADGVRGNPVLLDNR